MKYTRPLIVALIVILGLFTVGWKARTFFLQNKVTFLLNQRDMTAALKLLSGLQARNPGNYGNQFLQVKAQTIAGNYRQALAIALSENLKRAKPEVLYWKSLAEYQVGHTTSARAAASQFLETGKRLPDNASMFIAMAIAGNQKRFESHDIKDENNFRMLFQVEQGIYLTFNGLHEADLGNYDEAAGLFARAFALGSRNPESLITAAHAAALAGRVQEADMFLAWAGNKSVSTLYSRFLKDYEEFKSSSFDLTMQDIRGRGGKLELAHGLAWILSSYLKEDVKTREFGVLRQMADLQQEYPYDDTLQLRMAEILEILRRHEEARAIYQRLNEQAPNLATKLRLWSLDKLSNDEITSRIQGLAEKNHLVNYANKISSSYSGSTNTIKPGRAVTIPITVQANGTYHITLVARSAQMSQQWPLAEIKIGDSYIANKYINRANWDCYSLALPLDTGAHTIEITNTKIQPQAIGATPDLDLAAIFVTNAGVE